MDSSKLQQGFPFPRKTMASNSIASSHSQKRISPKNGGVLLPLASTNSPPLHPLLVSLTSSLTAMPSYGSGSQTARMPTTSSRTHLPPSQPMQLPKRQTSATMRRKLQALEAATGQTTAIGMKEKTPRQRGQHLPPNSDSPLDLPVSLIPPSAYRYSRPPITNFIASLDQHPSDRQWETVVFPSVNPLTTDGQGGELEVKMLASWFEQTWMELEQKIQMQAVRDKRNQLQLTQDGSLVAASHSHGPSTELVIDEKVNPNSNQLSPAMAHQLDLQRSKLCFIVFHELLRHVTAGCRRRGALLEQIWQTHQELNERRIAHRLDEIIAQHEQTSSQQIDRLTKKFEAMIKSEKAVHIKAGVDLTYLSAELEAKQRIIANLQEENDKDLLYSNQIVCHKEMAFLKLERESKVIQQENTRLNEDLKFLSEDKLNLEDTLAKLEEEKEELVQQYNTVQEIVDARLRGKSTQETQYDPRDVPAEPSEDEKLHHRAAVLIQKLFRGFRTRRKLKTQGLLSRKLIMKKLQGLHSSNKVGGGNLVGGINILIPLIPKGFSHLMSSLDMEMNRDHFVRLFARRNLLKWIFKLYVDKAAHDQQMIRTVKPRKDFADFIYDFYLLRHGTRDAAEMDLLDLFASLEKNADFSARVRMFTLFLNNGFRHRKILSHVRTSSMESQISISSMKSNETNNGQLSELHGSEAVAAQKERILRPYHHMDGSERMAHEMKLRLTIALTGGRHLSSRVLDFYLGFLNCAKKYGQGPFQNVSDNNDGIMWIDLTSIVDLTSKVLNRFPTYLLRATIAKLHNKASISRTAILQMGGLQPSPSANQSADVLATLLEGANSHTATPAGDLNVSHRFVDYDVMMEVIIEAYIDEDARMHHMLYDLFLHPNPQMGVHLLKDHKSITTPRPTTRDTTTSGGSDDDPPTFVHEAESALEPEMFSFIHFTDVLRALGCSWDEEKLLRIYQQSVQRAIHRQVTIEDFVLTVRCYGLMPVEVDFELVDSSARARQAMNSDEDFLPSLHDDGYSDATRDDELERSRHEELKEKMREIEATYTQKLEYASRRHEKEINQLKQAHEREMNLLTQTHQHQTELMKRQMEADRSKAASDYNLLFDSTTLELTTLRYQNEQREKRENETLNQAQATFKAKLADADHTIQLLQNKLNSKSEKYVKKKETITNLQARISELEGLLNRSGGLASPGANYLSPETKSLIDQYKKADDENRRINAALQAECETFKAKYKELAKTSKELLKMQHANSVVQQKQKKSALVDENGVPTATAVPTTTNLSDPTQSPLTTSSTTHVSLPSSSRCSPEKEFLGD